MEPYYHQLIIIFANIVLLNKCLSFTLNIIVRKEETFCRNKVKCVINYFNNILSSYIPRACQIRQMFKDDMQKEYIENYFSKKIARNRNNKKTQK